MIFSQYGGEGEDVVAGAVQVRRGLGQRGLQRRGDLGALGAHGDGVRLLEDRPDQGWRPTAFRVPRNWRGFQSWSIKPRIRAARLWASSMSVLSGSSA
jgi:hypothetical protein